MNWMQDRVVISSRGVITIPTRMREVFGLKANDQLIIEDTPQGLLLRPAVSIPIELYTDQRIKEFTRDDAAVAKLLDRSASRKSKSS
jgi:AbrB family looped-hinge helix DNA binding protein